MNPLSKFVQQNNRNKGIEISLSGASIINNIPARTITITKVIVKSITDNSINKTVVALTNVGNITLWSGDAYDAIGQWTDEDVINRIKEIYI